MNKENAWIHYILYVMDTEITPSFDKKKNSYNIAVNVFFPVIYGVCIAGLENKLCWFWFKGCKLEAFGMLWCQTCSAALSEGTEQQLSEVKTVNITGQNRRHVNMKSYSCENVTLWF